MVVILLQRSIYVSDNFIFLLQSLNLVFLLKLSESLVYNYFSGFGLFL